MKRYLDIQITTDLRRKLVFVTGPRQVGKTTLSKQLQASISPSQYLNYDVAKDRAIIARESWGFEAKLLVLDELHKMDSWKPWLKGVIDGRPDGQQQLVTGSARMDTFAQTGDSLAGRFLSWRLHPISVKEWCELGPNQPSGPKHTPSSALTHLIKRGGFPEPCLFPGTAAGDTNALRWRDKYANGLVREDILEFSRIQEVGSMRVLLELLRERVGSPLSYASIARDLGLSQPTVKRFVDILQALYIVFTVQPWHHNIARSLLQSPKIYFYDTGMVVDSEVKNRDGIEVQGLRFENAVATMLLKHVQYLQDAQAAPVQLHYLRNKDGAEIDFALSNGKQLTHLIECKWSDTVPHKAFNKFRSHWPDAKAIQLVRHIRSPELRDGIQITDAADWLNTLAA